MAKDKEKKEEKKEEQEGKKKGKLKLIIILLVLLGLLGGGGFFAYKKFFSSKKESVEQTKKEEKSKEEKKGKKEKGKEEESQEEVPQLQAKLVQLPTILVNLADPLGKRYLKVSIEIEVKGKEPEKLVQEKMPMIKDTLILLLSSKTFDDLSTLEKKYELKMEIANRLNQILGKPMVTKVFFTEFLVQ